MRCKNCGWNNPSGRTECEKCNSSLDVSEIVDGGGRRVTVREISGSRNIDSPVNDDEEKDGAAENLVCPHCGYPLMSNSKFCPKCGRSIDPASHVEAMAMAVGRKTVLPGKRSYCTLSMIADPKENLPEKSKLSYSGEEVVLNRSNTEPDNNTITSKVQAVLTYEDKKWYIQDKSELHTTYIRPGEKVEIKDGDVIMLGDRRFRFNS